MSMFTTERYQPYTAGVNATVNINRQSVGGFLCITSGTLSVTRSDGTAVVTAFPVTAGNWYFIPFLIGHNGGTVTLAGGASGTIGA